jgi:hypothetical protein
MPTLSEGNGERCLRFEIPAGWTGLKYDETPFYREEVVRSRGLKAVDFIVWTGESAIWLEVKNFCGAQVENRMRLDFNDDNVIGLPETRAWLEAQSYPEVSAIRRNPHLADEIAKKAIDTVVGLLGALRKQIGELDLASRSMFEGIPLHLVLFLHQDPALEDQRDYKRLLARLEQKIRSQLHFLKVTVEVVNRNTIRPEAGWQFLGEGE